MQTRILRALAALFLFAATPALSQEMPKREFRGAWLHIVGNQTIKTKTTEQLKAWISGTLDSLQLAGCNAIIYQVRPEADAFYNSKVEPWTRYLTGVQGKAPKPYWDPLKFAIEESHKRGMELHAWLNPYRVTLNESEDLCPSHLYHKRPDLFLKYGKQLYFDPAEPEAIDVAVKVVTDIVTRYDVDAIHMDDYFYPYPVAGQDFPDDKSFAKYGIPQGFTTETRADWRRENVTRLIRELSLTIKSIKPWVRFGISPFGIHRNDFQDITGSKTNGLSNYEQLYADVPLWLRAGYVDYNVPQLYWKIGHPHADFETLIHWWNDSNFGGQLYIGEQIHSFRYPDVNDSTKTQTEAKFKLVRELPNVHGNVWWPGWNIPKSVGTEYNMQDTLQYHYQKYLALIPAYTNIDSTAPEGVKWVRVRDGVIRWAVKHTNDVMQEPGFFIVYRFPAGTEINLNDSKYIQAITKDKSFKPAVADGSRYVITVTDHCWNESAASEAVVL